ncbi:hypothetical protein QYF48_21975 [Brevibacillus agri]|uniref:hypothetical protein n=1 Tax=Brevibacillus agri TaxID=51101 RepID=UPI0025B7000B|nr:hypothetical protein [Brevibacillus agri]MDN4095464.1 hypothetical protein [Brevibacillus agri]
MPVISKIRFTNVIYEGGSKRYNDELFVFDGHNGAILLENGGGKTVFIQTALQTVLPHQELAGRKIRETLSLAGTPAHIAIEWIINDSPRRYALTAVTLFLHNNDLDSLRYVYEYEEGNPHAIDELPFSREGAFGKKRPADKGDMQDYYALMSSRHMNARTFATIREYHAYLEEHFQLIPAEWRKVATINGAEGGVEIFFDDCKTTDQLVSQLLIPTVEEAISGNNGQAFAEIFEKQREQFKQSKQLRMQIQECQLLERSVQQYKQVFATYQESRELLEREKEWTKALFQHARNELLLVTAEAEKIAGQLSELQRKKHTLNWKKASRDIAAQEAVVKQYGAEWREESRKLEKMTLEAERAERHQYTLEYAKYQSQKQVAEEKLTLAESQIARLDEEQDVSQIKEALGRTNREIRGYYDQAEKEWKQQESMIRSQLDSVLQQKKAKRNESEQERERLEANKNKQAALRERMEGASKEQQRIAGNILSNPLRETVEEFIPVWQEELRKNQENQSLYQQHIKECEEQQAKLESRLEETRKELMAWQEQANQWILRCTEAEKQQKSVLTSLIEHIPRLSYLDSLYTRQESVTQTVMDKVAILEKEKEEAFSRERQVTRLSDEYAESGVYAADPELAALVVRWSESFHYLETGPQFLQEVLQRGEIALEALTARFPYWAAALITTEQEIEQLAARLQKHADQLRSPVILLSLQEARKWLEAGEEYAFSYRQIVPSHWQDNLDHERFEKWKRELQEKAAAVIQARKDKETEYQKLYQLKSELLCFYADYPQARYADWTRQRDECQAQKERCQKDIANHTEQIKKIEQERKHYTEKLSEEKGLEQTLGYRLQEANQYMLQKKVWEEAKRQEDELVREAELLKQNLQALDRALKTLEAQEQELQEEREEKTTALAHLRGEWLYEQVREFPPATPRFSFERLRAEREQLTDRLRERQASRAELEREAERLAKEIEANQRGMNLVLAKLDQPLEHPVVYPVDGDVQYERIVRKVAELKKGVAAQRIVTEERSNRLSEQNGRLVTLMEKYGERFGDEPLERFEGDLNDALKRLNQEEADTAAKQEYLLTQEQGFRQTVKELEDTIRELEAKNEVYRFAEAAVTDVPVREEELLAFPYQRLAVARKRIRVLSQKQETEQQEWRKVMAEKDRFKQFCERQIRNNKLRYTAMAGIQNKQEFSEVQEWADTLTRTIATSIRVLEDNLQGRDKELQDFITIVHTHLQRIAVELKTIPKKTSVQVESGRKEVYSFHVPEWKEEIGKQLLRQHVDWMLNRLDGDEFKDVEGKEDAGKMKKFIYASLQSKSLLGIVMGNDSIRVKCRKVSKDGQVSGALSSWEESNKWSGGEKWSKNMTLFLGILNYLAEKRQRIQQTGKRYRTVIVDNPFGKASSEHVLDPVFFIANELGFQLIALTAHAEGKFIRDYFPVVYSCRLRASASGDALIMTKEREIKHAYFRDYDPYSLLRLSEHEQLTLFT